LFDITIWNIEVIMAKKDKELMVPDELVMNKIYFIRGQKVMLDRDLAELYGVSPCSHQSLIAKLL